ncbi:Hypothetical protein NTJ_06113 [Nesidiocoris tenuis]|uniref:Uncharacterized protein n=1 Tax=Nesidiocoris tenuis TaxID=355587 RepID=A0ABN7APF5_9HEMI|nr:Hypothetical protein NTJ_06113 [Nesidiocoris tenuis]
MKNVFSRFRGPSPFQRPVETLRLNGELVSFDISLGVADPSAPSRSDCQEIAGARGNGLGNSGGVGELVFTSGKRECLG